MPDDFLKLVSRGENFYTVMCPLMLAGVQFGRRMNILRGPDGGLMLQSPFVPEGEIAKEIDQLGEVKAIVVPSSFHDTFIPEVMARYPDATYYICEKAEEFVNSVSDIRPISDMDKEWDHSVQRVLLAGMPKINESVFYHAASKSFLVCDLIFYLENPRGLWTTIFSKLFGFSSTPGASRMFRSMIQDKKAFCQSLEQILEWDFNIIIPSHFDLVRHDAKGAIERMLKQIQKR